MTDVLWDLQTAHWHHGDGSSGGEPVGFVISAGIVAHLIDVAVNKWHGAEARQAGASKTWVGEGGREEGNGEENKGLIKLLPKGKS